MCLIAADLPSETPKAFSQGMPWVLLANRDEFHARPSSPMAWWTDPLAPDFGILSGRDLKNPNEPGTWMALSEDGYFAALTNVRDPESLAHAGSGRTLLSRGSLALAAIRCLRNHAKRSQAELESSLRSQALTDGVAPSRYGAFNLILGALPTPSSPSLPWFWISNRPNWQLARLDSDERMAGERVFGLSNAALNDPWPKLVGLRDGLTRLKHSVPGQGSKDGLPLGPLDSVHVGSGRSRHADEMLIEAGFALLADQTPAKDHELPQTGLSLDRERLLSSRFIVSKSYGTRSSSVVIVAPHGGILVAERGYSPDGLAVYERRFEFRSRAFKT